MNLDLDGFGEQFLIYLDHIAPRLGVGHQTVYLFLLGEAFRSHQDLVTFSMKTGRFRMGKGTGDGGKPMAENTVVECVQKLCQLRLLEKIDSGRFGTRVRVKLPKDAVEFHPVTDQIKRRSIEDVDFFNEPLARATLLLRERQRCFYCARSLTFENFVIEHVVSRPFGNNGFRNLVAACQACNNRKSEQSASDYFRTLYRDGFLNEQEFTTSQEKLSQLVKGMLVPEVNDVILDNP